jgi:hypothetical protein
VTTVPGTSRRTRATGTLRVRANRRLQLPKRGPAGSLRERFTSRALQLKRRTLGGRVPLAKRPFACSSRFPHASLIASHKSLSAWLPLTVGLGGQGLARAWEGIHMTHTRAD